MNESAQAHAYAHADFAEAHERFVRLFREKFPALQLTGTVLDLGCGPADVTRRFACAYPRCRLHGVDGAANMLALGQQANQQAHLAERIELFERRLPCMELPLAHYAAVISNSLLHHLHDPLVLWHSVKQFGNSGAPVFIMDLMRPATRPAAEAIVKHYAANEPAILQQDFLASLCAAFTPAEIRAQLHAVHLDTLRSEVVSDRHVIVYGYLP